MKAHPIFIAATAEPPRRPPAVPRPYRRAVARAALLAPLLGTLGGCAAAERPLVVNQGHVLGCPQDRPFLEVYQYDRQNHGMLVAVWWDGRLVRAVDPDCIAAGHEQVQLDHGSLWALCTLLVQPDVLGVEDCSLVCGSWCEFTYRTGSNTVSKGWSQHCGDPGALRLLAYLLMLPDEHGENRRAAYEPVSAARAPSRPFFELHRRADPAQFSQREETGPLVGIWPNGLVVRAVCPLTPKREHEVGVLTPAQLWVVHHLLDSVPLQTTGRRWRTSSETYDSYVRRTGQHVDGGWHPANGDCPSDVRALREFLLTTPLIASQRRPGPATESAQFFFVRQW